MFVAEFLHEAIHYMHMCGCVIHTRTHPEAHRESPGRCGSFVRAVSFSPEHAGRSNRDKAATSHPQIWWCAFLTVSRQLGLHSFQSKHFTLLLKMSDFSPRQIGAWNTEAPLLPPSSPEVQVWWPESWDGRGLDRVEESRRQLQWVLILEGLEEKLSGVYFS